MANPQMSHRAGGFDFSDPERESGFSFTTDPFENLNSLFRRNETGRLGTAVTQVYFVTAHRQIEGEEPPIRLVRLRSVERRRDVPQRGYLRSPVGYDRWPSFLRLVTKTNAPPINMRPASNRAICGSIGTLASPVTGGIGVAVGGTGVGVGVGGGPTCRV